jgi:hypothetical protein
MDQVTIIPAGHTTLESLCSDLATWPALWEVEHSDLPIGQCIVEAIQPFLIDLLHQGLADKTLARHRDHLQMLGGEIIRRCHDHPDLAKQSARDMLFNLVDDDGGPLIWPTITESAQNAFDATCRKLHRFLNQQKNRA